MPLGVENLYKESWQRHGEDEEDYRAEAAHYFQLVIQWHKLPGTQIDRTRNSDDDRLSLLNITVASNDRWRRDILHRKDTLGLRDLLAAVDHTRQRIQLCCGGLLEIRDMEAPENWNYEQFEPKFWANLVLMPLSAFFSPGEDGKDGVLPSAHDLVKLWEAVMCTDIVFIHRIARDFILDKPIGRRIMQSCVLTGHDVIIQLLQSLIARYLVFPS